jgi:hypothetical protein
MCGRSSIHRRTRASASACIICSAVRSTAAPASSASSSTRSPPTPILQAPYRFVLLFRLAHVHFRLSHRSHLSHPSHLICFHVFLGHLVTLARPARLVTLVLRVCFGSRFGPTSESFATRTTAKSKVDPGCQRFLHEWERRLRCQRQRWRTDADEKLLRTNACYHSRSLCMRVRWCSGDWQVGCAAPGWRDAHRCARCVAGASASAARRPRAHVDQLNALWCHLATHLLVLEAAQFHRHAHRGGQVPALQLDRTARLVELR